MSFYKHDETVDYIYKNSDVGLFRECMNSNTVNWVLWTLRKNWSPTCGGGSQATYFYTHKRLAELTIDIMNKKIKEWSEDGPYENDY